MTLTAQAIDAPIPVPTETFAEATRALHAAAVIRALEGAGAGALGPLLRGRLALRPRTVDLAADAALRDAVHELLAGSWTPTDLHAFTVPRLTPLAQAYFVDALATTSQWTSRWFAELGTLGSRIWWTIGEPHLSQWARRHAQPRAETVAVAVDVLALLSFLPRARPEHAADGSDALRGTLVADQRIVGRIDALIARAAGSDFADEADACARKAQELMVRYASVPAVAVEINSPEAVVAAVKELCTESPAAAVRAVANLVGRAVQAVASLAPAVTSPAAVRAITGRPSPHPRQA